MHKIFKKSEILTIPNLLSLIRLALIPVIAWLYIEEKNYYAALGVLIISGITDIADGIIARRFNMISDFGKIFDPIADKLTQMSVLLCLVSRFHYMIIPFICLVVKEISTAITSLVSIKRANSVKGAVWHGKLATVVIYTTIALHLVWGDIPPIISHTSVGIALGVMLMSFIMYTVQNIKAIKNKSFES